MRLMLKKTIEKQRLSLNILVFACQSCSVHCEQVIVFITCQNSLMKIKIIKCTEVFEVNIIDFP